MKRLCGTDPIMANRPEQAAIYVWTFRDAIIRVLSEIYMRKSSFRDGLHIKRKDFPLFTIPGPNTKRRPPNSVNMGAPPALAPTPAPAQVRNNCMDLGYSNLHVLSGQLVSYRQLQALCTTPRAVSVDSAVEYFGVPPLALETRLLNTSAPQHIPP